jgi:exodeoxyribonuclease V gamma subunit
VIDAPDEAQARDALRQLLSLHARGLHEPLWFAPYTGWDIWNADPETRRGVAWKRWHGDGNGGWAEGEGEAIRLALRGRDPFANEADYRQLEDTSLVIYDLVRRGHARDHDAAEGAAA